MALLLPIAVLLLAIAPATERAAQALRVTAGILAGLAILLILLGSSGG